MVESASRDRPTGVHRGREPSYSGHPGRSGYKAQNDTLALMYSSIIAARSLPMPGMSFSRRSFAVVAGSSFISRSDSAAR